MNMNLTLLGQAISFAIFVWFCLKYVWPPIIAALEAREAQIADGLASAEQGKYELENAEKRVKEILSDGKEKAQDLVSQAQKRADEIHERAKNEAVEEKVKIIASASAEIEQERNQALDGLRKQVGSLALQGAEQILMREIDEKSHRDVLTKLAGAL
ncbi:MAG: F0F1 ATP synthase subunit B [Gammaproteobacteria bacterium]|jgi:F-type H+-transporting ATPase subunit b|nr:F0F1 ATP synthase subunit B [Pseudomonadota bacterium]MDG2302812.1 F0F1 ATP synthase subunit B [Gammaproteobacteria bacterium]MBT5065027.1 F0F1 ATP synthase subunit B [Pseudomonadota bacterium]MBT6192228.1 F0F1 ATP synthase subunit B [Pseudomonadota bacterium]MBT6465539.1 F0F1 ATP synthase subunit B [Pseudomonadota bacterium]|tara:strand:+ start:11270 stop:11740 length:471 start_codon:yes stop_codon:yes gene_type:complete